MDGPIPSDDLANFFFKRFIVECLPDRRKHPIREMYTGRFTGGPEPAGTFFNREDHIIAPELSDRIGNFERPSVIAG